MAKSEEVFEKIREMNECTLNPHRSVLLSEIASKLLLEQDSLLVLLTELQNRGLVKIHNGTVVSVSLTHYGAAHKNPPGGLNSD